MKPSGRDRQAREEEAVRSPKSIYNDEGGGVGVPEREGQQHLAHTGGKLGSEVV